MTATLIDNPAANVGTIPDRGSDVLVSDVLVLRNNRKSWLLEICVYAAVISICTFFCGVGIHFAITDDGSRLVSIVVACLGLAGTWGMLGSALKRYEYYQDGEPKLTLSKTTLCDHRTGLSVPLESIAAILLDRQVPHKHEVRADLHVSMNDGECHVFDLLSLDMCSKEIAWRVKNDSGVEDAEGISAPTGPGVVGHVLVAALLIGVLWQVFIHAKPLLGW